MAERKNEVEKTLDPVDEAGWEDLRAVGHRMLDGILDHMQGLRQGPVWQKAPSETRLRLESEAVPRVGQGAAAAYESFTRDVLPYGIGNAHPRFWGWVMGGGTGVGMLAEMLAAGMNPNVGGFDDSATLVEERVIGWMAELMGMPEGTSGLLTSGGRWRICLGWRWEGMRGLGSMCGARG